MKRICNRHRRPSRRNRGVARWALALGLAGIAVPPVRGDDSKPESFPPAPSVTLAPVEGVDDVAAYTSAVADHVARLVELAGKANLPILRAELQLAGANLILGRQIEPACTRAFWGLSDLPEHRVDNEKLTEAFDTAQQLLEDAWSNINDARRAIPKDEPEAAETDSETVQRLRDDAVSSIPGTEQGGPKNEPESGEDENEKDPSMSARISAASSHRRTLEAFHQALRVALLPPGDDEHKRTRRRAASELSALVEHDDRRVATAAGFWQAFLRKGETDPHAALARLDYALDEFAPAEQPYAFFARVMRCDVLAGHGQRVAALALLTQMEERALGWYPDEEPRKQALGAIAWRKLHALHAWHDTLDPKERADERVWCRAQAATLIADTLPEPNRLPRLSPAIPMLFEADAVEAAAAAYTHDAP